MELEGVIEIHRELTIVEKLNKYYTLLYDERINTKQIL